MEITISTVLPELRDLALMRNGGSVFSARDIVKTYLIVFSDNYGMVKRNKDFPFSYFP